MAEFGEDEMRVEVEESSEEDQGPQREDHNVRGEYIGAEGGMVETMEDVVRMDWARTGLDPEAPPPPPPRGPKRTWDDVLADYDEEESEAEGQSGQGLTLPWERPGPIGVILGNQPLFSALVPRNLPRMQDIPEVPRPLPRLENRWA